MDLAQLVDRQPIEPWTGVSKIPWHEPDFSRRMLREHLDQQHGAASRPAGLIDRHIEWLHKEILGATPRRVLDLGCGPGFYSQRLATLGHECLGIDFSPASIDHAAARARHCGSSARYRLADIRDGNFGSGFDAAILVFGEFNAFTSKEAAVILGNIRDSLGDGGKMVIEPHTASYLRQLGHRAPNWFTSSQSVFSDRPHLC
ncbi:MAG: class I SAM-dependent methyltransferase, partial [Gammaproteobacteria bacterium]|nr:class I SAM-dependent methyltransferase [Gammaproteobacteria bacterium]